MSNELERVARALFEWDIHEHSDPKPTWDDSEGMRVIFREGAAVAIAAMTPTPQVVETATWEGPYLDPDLLDAATKQGDVVRDDVGTLRQRRYPNSKWGGGFTQYGCGPLSAKQLLEGGKRPAWVLRLAESTAHPTPDADARSALATEGRARLAERDFQSWASDHAETLLDALDPHPTPDVDVIAGVRDLCIDSVALSDDTCILAQQILTTLDGEGK